MAKAKKIIIVAVSLSLLLCSALSVSAETYSFGDFEVKSVDFFLIRDDEWMNGGTVSYTSLDGGLRLRVELSSDFGTPQKGDRFSLFVECAPTDGAYINSQQNVTGSVRLGVKSPPNDLDEDSTDTYAYRWDTSQNHEQYARNAFWTSDWGEYCTFKFEDSSLGYSFNRYIFCCEWEITSSSELSTYARYVYLSNAEFEFQSQSDYEADKILDKEKNEAQSSGNAASDDVAAAVPDQSAGFTEALSTFVQAMSTTDTTCEIDIPALVVPKLEGLFPETVLLEPQKLTFDDAIALIPQAIMKLVQALTTIGLIVFCFKELYNTIEYVLTLRKGGKNE